MSIERQFVTIEQAMLLKEKGFDMRCEYFYNEGSGFKLQHDLILRTGKDVFFEAPEIWQVVEWLYHEHHIWIRIDSDFITFDAAILRPDNDPVYLISTLGDMTEYTFTTSYEAYLGAIDYVLKKLI